MTLFKLLAFATLLFITSAAFANDYGPFAVFVHDRSIAPFKTPWLCSRPNRRSGPRASPPTPAASFNSTAVPLGEYSVSVASQGFAQTAQNVHRHLGSVPVVHFQLQVAMANEKVSSPTRRRRRHRQLHSHYAHQPSRHRAHSRSRRHQQHGDDHRLRPRAYVTHDMLHMRGGHQTTWLLDGIRSSTPLLRKISGRSSIPRIWITSKSIAAAIARSSATAPTEFSTSCPHRLRAQ